MATRDQALFLEMYLGLKRALKRKSYDSDSDSEIDQTTNRGNKLKKRARFVHQGQLAGADGSSMLTEVVDHAGYRREIISRNPPLIDDDGYSVESDEDAEVVQEAVAAAAEENPYSSIHLEQLLAPLTTVTDLPSHPSLSRPFYSKAISELVVQGRNWTQKENRALWKVKPLLTKFCGDHNWVDCRLMLTPDDSDLFDDDLMARMASSRKTNGAKSRPTAMDDGNDEDTNMHDGTDRPNGALAPLPTSLSEDDVEAEGEGEGDDDGEGGYIHPLFLAPRTAHPEPNGGLPEHEAEDVRRLLQLWVQKQEEVARGANKLHEGLLRADRLRKTVLLWSKAEANRDLSDGEDYYDWDTWGLTEDLKKGYDEEEEDLQQPHKKTRNRK
ncbi:rxt2-like protein [Grosmannia clavigera kw1407]|uniref:Rxt2-like protein n=1 Tax=Grosmannia clavigera (strain kw1407 / UAMH 11150) TaxID=655863 RepID=F0XFY0_GROCL|nr:rxt2-like protein [Grosmannia clavigera kw1407]EFX03417.1 rxt2-like protein [Grosmannia clavigera kw1407]